MRLQCYFADSGHDCHELRTRKLLPCQSRTQESSGFLPEEFGYEIGNRATSQWIGSQPKQSFFILFYFIFCATCLAILPSVTYPVGREHIT